MLEVMAMSGLGADTPNWEYMHVVLRTSIQWSPRFARFAARIPKPREGRYDHALARATALSQFARRAAARSRGIAGSKTRSTRQFAATSAASFQ